MFKIRFLLACLVLGGSLFAQQNYTMKYDAISALTTGEFDWVEKDLALRNRIDKRELLLRIDFGDVFNFGSGGDAGFDIDISMELEIEVLNSLGQDITSAPLTKVFAITNNAPEYNWWLDLTAYEEVAKVRIKVNSFDDVNCGQTVKTFISDPTNDNCLRITANQKVEQMVDVRLESDLSLPDVTVLALPRNTSGETLEQNKTLGRIQNFSWQLSGGDSEFDGYELQILKLYNREEKYNVNDNAVACKIDWNSAFAIYIENPVLDQQNNTVSFENLTLPWGYGFYVWRVRPIGNYFEGTVNNPMNWGAWSASPKQGEEVEYHLSELTGSDIPEVFYMKDQEEGKIWNYARVFTEGNKVHESITYADGLLNPRQSQVYLSSEDKKMVSQVVLDYSGRPALNTMGVPVDGRADGYIEGFVKNEEQTVSTGEGDVVLPSEVYTAEDFDKEYDADAETPQKDFDIYNPSTITSSQFDYYSSSNPDERIPDAEGYVFSRTIYMNDGSGRVAEQSSPGKTHALGEQSNGMGRTVRTFYTKATPAELYRIFGDEAPNPNKVYKVITMDANNTGSVSYMGDGGKVLATCLTMGNDEGGNLDPLEVKTGEQTPFKFDYRTNQNIVEGNSLMSNQRFVLTQQQPITINYDLSVQSEAIGCLTVDAGCLYSVNIDVYQVITMIDHSAVLHSGEENTEKEIYNKVYSFSKGHGDVEDENDPDQPFTSLSNLVLPAPGDQPIVLEPGTYIIRKTLSLRTDVEEQTANFALNDNIFNSLIETIKGWMNAVTTEGEKQSVFIGNVGQYNTDLQLLSDQSSIDNFKTTYNLAAEFPLTLEDLAEHKTKRTISIFYKKDEDGTPTDEVDYLTIQTCCDDLVIPFGVDVVGETCVEYEEEVDGVMTPFLKPVPLFSEYVTEKLDLDKPGSVNKWSGVVKGYSRVNLDRMVWHMLNDEYAYDPSVEDERDGTETPVEQLEVKAQYTCQQLWDCWKAVVDPFMGIEEGQEGDDGGSTSDKVDDESDDGGETHDDHFDDNLDMGKIKKWFVKRKLSKQMRDVEKEPLNAELATIFLSCAGYKYAAIIIRDEGVDYDPNSEEDQNNMSFVRNHLIQTDDSDELSLWKYGHLPNPGISGPEMQYVLPEDREEYVATDKYYYAFKKVPLSGEFYYRINLFPHVMNPVFAFKYYEYVDRSYVQCERATCYIGPKTGENPSTTYPLCNDGCVDMDRTTWRGGDYMNFYTCITSNSLRSVHMGQNTDESTFVDCAEFMNYVEMPIPTEEGEEKDLATGAKEIWAGLVQGRKNQLLSCESKCEGRYNQIFSALVDKHENKCWVVTDKCPSEIFDVNGELLADVNEITYDDVRVMTDDLVDHCKQYCLPIPPQIDVNDPAYDANYDFQQVEGEPVDPHAYSFCTEYEDLCISYDYKNRQYKNPETTIGLSTLDKCEKERVFKVGYWNVEVDVLGRCENENDWEEWVNGAKDDKCEEIEDPGTTSTQPDNPSTIQITIEASTN